MFDNIGKKIKTLVKTAFVIVAILCFISGLVLFGHEDTVAVGLLIIVGGIFLAWISSFILYGFGELVDNSQEIIEILRNGSSSSSDSSTSETEDR